MTQIPWDKRKGVTTPQLVGDFFMKTGDIKEGLALAFAPPAIFGLGAAGGAEFYIRNRGEGGPQALAGAMGGSCSAVCSRTRCSCRSTRCGSRTCRSYSSTSIAKKRRRSEYRSTRSSTRCRRTLGSYYVNDFNKYGRTWQVLMSAEPAYRTRPDDIGAVWVRSDRNEMVPLRSVARVEYTSGPDSLDRYNNLQAVKVFASAAPGVSSGQVIARISAGRARSVAGSDFDVEFTGASFQEQQSSGHVGARARAWPS